VHINRLLGITCIAALVGCSDSTGPNNNGAGVGFNFTGSATGSGTFSASGTMASSSANLNNQSAAAAAQNADFDSFDVLGVKARGSSRYDLALVQTARLTPGTTDIDQNCDSSTTNCAGFGFLTNVNFTTQDFDLVCGLVDGSITVTEVTNDRVKGTFSGSGICIDQATNISTFTTTNGNFDTPIVADLPQAP